MASGRKRKADERKPPKDERKAEGGRKAQQSPKVIANRFKPGNDVWKLSPRRGPNPIYADPQELLDDCLAFFDWLAQHPVMAQKVVSAGGVADVVSYELPRAPTIERLCVYLGIDRSTWTAWGDSSALSGVVARVNAMMTAEKLEGALVEVYNPNLVARLEGLAERKDHTSTDGSMTPRSGLPFAELPKDIQKALLREMQKHDKLREGETKGKS